MRSTTELFQALGSTTPPLETLHREHLAEWNGELLAHLLMPEVLHWLATHIETDQSVVDRALGVLEEFLTTGDDAVDNVIAVSFLENLGLDPNCPGERLLRARLGPALRRQLEDMEAWEPEPPPNETFELPGE